MILNLIYRVWPKKRNLIYIYYRERGTNACLVRNEFKAKEGGEVLMIDQEK